MVLLDDGVARPYLWPERGSCCDHAARISQVVRRAGWAVQDGLPVQVRLVSQPCHGCRRGRAYVLVIGASDRCRWSLPYHQRPYQCKLATPCRDHSRA